MISQTVEYALRAVVTIAQHEGRPCTAQQISAITQVPAPYLSKLMQGLVRAGITTSQRGLHGGFLLARQPTELTIWEVIEAVEPIKRIRECPLGIGAHGGTLCPLHRKLDDAVALVEESFQSTTVADVLAQPGSVTPLCEEVKVMAIDGSTGTNSAKKAKEQEKEFQDQGHKEMSEQERQQPYVHRMACEGVWLSQCARLVRTGVARSAVLLVAIIDCEVVQGQLDYERDPINYSQADPTGPVARLQQRLDRGEIHLEFDDKHGYLRSLLAHLDVPVSSQMLVFSKTSFQQRRISPRTPRAVYFGDDAFVGWVQYGDVIEISTADPQLGAIFYTLKQERTDAPKIVRDRGQCIVCHDSSRTAGVPGHFVRSVFTDLSGRPRLGSGTFTTDYRSPFRERWGGWYVSGTHGAQRHMGNVVATDRSHPEKLDQEAGANMIELSSLLNTAPYLTPNSDIVALMVLEHQTHTYNLMTYANFETRAASHYDQVMDESLDRAARRVSESTQLRIEAAGEKLVEAMLFVDEFPLWDSVEGTSSFAKDFSSRGPHDSQGRSLREFDLTLRLMKYPCSYLIYSDPFDELPTQAKDYVYRRLFDVLSGADKSERFSHLSSNDKKSILQILQETKSDLPEYWKPHN